MKKIGILAILAVLIAVSCKRPKPETAAVTETSRWTFDTLHLAKEIFLNNDSTKGGLKLTLEFDYPSTFVNDSILKAVQTQFLASFTDDQNGSYKGLTPVKGFEAFTDKNVEESVELGKAAQGSVIDFSEYYKTVKTSVTDTTLLTITGRTETLQYSGGAHDSRYIDYFNIDLRNGNRLTIESLFKPETSSRLVTLIKEVLATTKNSNGDNITLLDPDSVQPSQNFYFNEQGLVFVYNTYEITPHSDGLIQALIPYDKLKDLIADPYKEIITLKTKKA
ncbi:RsiV family protein [Dysgonomonas capnocytophagoides]|uniref:RsiV family protein n=1 Tax=Dysgonomonas capnocytophagoides TaxID=45254 RepID=UPI00333F171C